MSSSGISSIRYFNKTLLTLVVTRCVLLYDVPRKQVLVRSDGCVSGDAGVVDLCESAVDYSAIKLDFINKHSFVLQKYCSESCPTHKLCVRDSLLSVRFIKSHAVFESSRKCFI